MGSWLKITRLWPNHSLIAGAKSSETALNFLFVSFWRMSQAVMDSTLITNNPVERVEGSPR